MSFSLATKNIPKSLWEIKPKPEVFVILSKSQCLRSQPIVKVNTSFLNIRKLRGNQSS